jgi:hypothetical protein
MLVLAMTRYYTAIRIAGAGCAAVRALGWILERFPTQQPVGAGDELAGAAARMGDRIGLRGGWHVHLCAVSAPPRQSNSQRMIGNAALGSWICANDYRPGIASFAVATTNPATSSMVS